MTENRSREVDQSSTGLSENLAGLLTYLVGPITGIIFLIIEKESKFVRFHAIQSIGISIALIVLNSVLWAIPILGWLLAILISPLTLILWIVLMWKAYSGKMFKLPIIGQMAEKQLEQMGS